MGFNITRCPEHFNVISSIESFIKFDFERNANVTEDDITKDMMMKRDTFQNVTFFNDLEMSVLLSSVPDRVLVHQNSKCLRKLTVYSFFICLLYFVN